MKFIYTITLSALLLSCANTNQSVVKSDDELSSTINLLFEKYVANDWELSEYYADDVIARVNNQELNGYENLIAGYKAHHELLYDNISVDELYVHTNYFSDGEVWSNSWFTWSAVGKTTGEEYTNRAHFDYKWENGKIVEMLAYYSEYADLKESAALQAAQE